MSIVYTVAFAAVLRKRRGAKGMSQELFAEKADIHPTHVGLSDFVIYYGACGSKMPSKKTLLLIYDEITTKGKSKATV